MSASPRILQCSGGIGPCSGATRWQRTPQVRLWLAWVLLAVAVGAACSADVAGAAESNPLARTGYKGELIDLPRDSLSWTDGHSAQSELVVAKARAQKLQWRSWRQRRSLQQAPGTPDGSAPSPPADAPMYGQGGLDPAASPGPAASPDDGFSFGSSIIDANSIMRPGECPLGTEAPFINVTFRIIGQNVLPITPALQSSIVKSFQSTFALVNWESNVTLSNVPLLNNISFLPPGAGLAPGAAPGEAPQLAPASAPAADSMDMTPGPSGGQLAGAPTGQMARRLLQRSPQPPADAPAEAPVQPPAASPAEPPAEPPDVLPAEEPAAAPVPGPAPVASADLTTDEIRAFFNVEAIIASAQISFTRNSSFVKDSQISQTAALEASLASFGYQARLVLQDYILLYPNSYILTSRIPEYFAGNQSIFIVATTVQASDLIRVVPNPRIFETGLASIFSSFVPNLSSAKVISTKVSRLLDYAEVLTLVATSDPNNTISPAQMASYVRPPIESVLLSTNKSAIVEVTANFAPVKNISYLFGPQVAKKTLQCQPIAGYLTPVPQSSGGGGGLGVGGIVGIVIAVLVAFVAIIALFITRAWVARAKRRAKHSEGGWGGLDAQLLSYLVAPEDIEICKQQDGTDWLLGAGAFGRVYKGLRGGVQDIAIKQLLHTGDGQLEAFMSEVGLLKGLNYDRNIVQFYGVCLQEGSQPMLICELMAGGNVASAIARADERIEWYWQGHQVALDVARGLFFLHSHGVLHGDIKSQNVLLTETWTAKLGDVGLARLNSDEAGAALAWTLAYAAPEVLLAEVPTLACDVYSFGVLLHEIVLSETPHTRGKLPPPRVPEQCPQDVWDLIVACSASNVSDRPSAKDIFERLKASAEAHKLPTRDSALERTSTSVSPGTSAMGRTTSGVSAAELDAAVGRGSSRERLQREARMRSAGASHPSQHSAASSADGPASAPPTGPGGTGSPRSVIAPEASPQQPKVPPTRTTRKPGSATRQGGRRTSGQGARSAKNLSTSSVHASSSSGGNSGSAVAGSSKGSLGDGGGVGRPLLLDLQSHLQQLGLEVGTGAIKYNRQVSPEVATALQHLRKMVLHDLSTGTPDQPKGSGPSSAQPGVTTANGVEVRLLGGCRQRSLEPLNPFARDSGAAGAATTPRTAAAAVPPSTPPNPFSNGPSRHSPTSGARRKSATTPPVVSRAHIDIVKAAWPEAADERETVSRQHTAAVAVASALPRTADGLDPAAVAHMAQDSASSILGGSTASDSPKEAAEEAGAAPGAAAEGSQPGGAGPRTRCPSAGSITPQDVAARRGSYLDRYMQARRRSEDIASGSIVQGRFGPTDAASLRDTSAAQLARETQLIREFSESASSRAVAGLGAEDAGYEADGANLYDFAVTDPCSASAEPDVTLKASNQERDTGLPVGESGEWDEDAYDVYSKIVGSEIPSAGDVDLYAQFA